MDVGVFARGQRCNSLPAHRIPRDRAEELVETGFARWVNSRQNNVIMTREPAELKLRDQSCAMGPRVTLAAVMGSKRHQALVVGWGKEAA